MNHKILLLSALLALALTGCSDAPDMPGDEGATPPTIDVPVTLSLASGWTIDPDASRSAPPNISTDNGDKDKDDKDGTETAGDTGMDELLPDEVMLYTFRRLEGSTDPFLYDASNSNEALKFGESKNPDQYDIFPADHQHQTAKGTLHMVQDYEYRVVALAYAEKRTSDFASTPLALSGGEGSRFSLPGLVDGSTRFEDFKAQIATPTLNHNDWDDFFFWSSSDVSDQDIDKHISHRVLDTPQLFWGECTTADGDNIIRYSAGESDNGTQLRGILYRGVAKVELKISTTTHTVLGVDYPTQWIALMAETTNTAVGLTDYDCFLSPSDPIAKYTPIAYTTASDGETITLTAYMLPTATRLAIRVKNYANLVTTRRDAQLTTKDVANVGGNATGIISPELHDQVFFLRRNHKYVLTVSDSEKLLKYSPLD